jgi:hypothetical protein
MGGKNAYRILVQNPFIKLSVEITRSMAGFPLLVFNIRVTATRELSSKHDCYLISKHVI